MVKCFTSSAESPAIGDDGSFFCKSHFLGKLKAVVNVCVDIVPEYSPFCVCLINLHNCVNCCGIIFPVISK